MSEGAESGLSRRAMLKATLKTSAYAAPLVTSAAIAGEVAAVSPSPPSTGSVTFTGSGPDYLARGAGFPANAPFLLIVFGAGGNPSAFWVVMTDGVGQFTTTITASGQSLAGMTAAALVNGGNIFADLSGTIGGGIAATQTAAAVPVKTPPQLSATSTHTPIPGVPTTTPTSVPTRSGPPQLITAPTETAIAAQTAAALTAVAPNAIPPKPNAQGR